jgi:LacI family transcriptional regulator
VAREAKVSIATVSRVLNGDHSVRVTTRKRVDEAIQALHYVPHSGARSLIMRTTRTIGVMLPDIFGDFFSEAIRGLDGVARKRGYSLLVTCTHGDSRSAQTMLKAMHGRVDGLVVLSADLGVQTFLRNLPPRTPVVFLNRVEGPGSFDSVSVANVEGSLAMTRYLLGLGHERILFVKGPEENRDAQERLQGYREAMAGRATAGELPGDFTEAGGYQAGIQALAILPPPTAIFAANDASAIGVSRALQERGVRIPEDISLAGFDDIPLARYMTPPLTSIRAPIAELGASAAERLLQKLEGDDTLRPRQETLEVVLVARASTSARRPGKKGGTRPSPETLPPRSPPE